MISTLTAEECMLATQPIAIGSGSLKAAEAREIMAGWERRINRSSQTGRAAPASPDMLQTFGIGYVIVPARPHNAA